MSNPTKITGEWIKSELDRIQSDFQKKYEENSFQSTFVLHSEVTQLNKEIFELRKKCPHKYILGKCIYCKSKEPEEK